MDPLTLALIGGAVGLAKSELVDRPREKRQRQANAEIARWSPWTGMAPGTVNEADPFGSALQGGLTGAMLGQQFGTNKAAASADASAAGQAATPKYSLGLPEFKPTYMNYYDPQIMNPYMLMGF